MKWHSEYREEWVQAGYVAEMGSACVLRPPPPEFIRLYYLTSSTHAISSIEKGRLKISRLSDLNDPLEFLGLKVNQSRARAKLNEFRDGEDQRIGLLCFSENWTSPVLWGHYGDKHRGVCLGFNVRRSVVESVDYIHDRLPELDDPNAVLPDDLKQRLRRAKFHHWAYEQEQRVLVELGKQLREGDLYFYPFDSDVSLAEVILGPRCELSLPDTVSLTRKHHATAVTFQARIAFKWFAVVPLERLLHLAG